jgi:hypothetical protein
MSSQRCICTSTECCLHGILNSYNFFVINANERKFHRSFYAKFALLPLATLNWVNKTVQRFARWNLDSTQTSCVNKTHHFKCDWLRARWQRSRSSSPSRIKTFLFSMSSRPVLGPTQPPIQWVPRDLSPGVKRPGREADHSSLASAEVKKMWIYTFTPPYAFMA